MKTLKILAEHIDGTYHNIDKSPIEYCDELTQHYLQDENSIISNWWYLHGELESEIGYDRGVMCNLSDFNLLIKNCYYNGNDAYFDVICLEDGIYDVEIIGIDKPCIGYFWINKTNSGIPQCRGLVCFKDDKEACEYAKQKYKEKSLFL